MRTVWLLFLGFALIACSSDGEDETTAVEPDDDDSAWLDADDEDFEAGSLSIDLPGDHGSGEAMCNLNLMRAVDKQLASVILTIDVAGKGCDSMWNCDDPNMRTGQVNFSGGIDGDQPFAAMALNYEPPTAADEGVFWMYNVLLKTSPFSQFDMWVDGEKFNVLTSDTRGAEDLAKGPHLWNTKIDIEADMLQATDTDEQSSPGIQTRGKFSYQGPCEIYAKYMKL